MGVESGSAAWWRREARWSLEDGHAACAMLAIQRALEIEGDPEIEAKLAEYAALVAPLAGKPKHLLVADRKDATP